MTNIHNSSNNPGPMGRSSSIRTKNESGFNHIYCTKSNRSKTLKPLNIIFSIIDGITILDKKDRTLPKPFNIRPGYDMKYVTKYILLLMVNDMTNSSIMRDYLIHCLS